MKNAVLRICQTFVPLNHEGTHTCLSVGQMDSQKFIVSVPHQSDFIKCVDNTHDLFKTTIKPSLKISFFFHPETVPRQEQKSNAFQAPGEYSFLVPRVLIKAY